MQVAVFVYACKHTYMCICVSVCDCMRVCVLYWGMRACVHACFCLGMYACRRVGVQACGRAWVYAYMDVGV